MKTKVGFALCLGLAISGCASVPQNSEPKKQIVFGQKDEINIYLPAPTTNESAKSYFNKLEGGGKNWSSFSGNNSTKLYGYWTVEEATFTYETGGCGWVSNKCSPIRDGKAKISGKVTSEKLANAYKIKLHPASYDIESTKNFITAQPHFNENNLRADVPELITMIKGFSLRNEFEFESKYSAESISSNFSRALRSYGPYTDNNLRKEYKDTYFIETSQGIPVKIAVASFPYRDGSKTQVLAWVLPFIDGQNVDYTVVNKEVEEKLKNIVEL